MKNLIIVAIALFTLNSVAQEKEVKKTPVKQSQRISSQNQSPDVRAKIETKKMAKQLELTAEQYDKVHNVMVEHFTERQSMRKEIKEEMATKEKVSKAEMKETLLKNKEEHTAKLNSQLKEILTAEQYEKYQQLDKEQMPRKKVMIKKN